MVLLFSRSARSEWRGDVRVNVEPAGKQASRGGDCPWSISVDNNNRIHVVWEDRRQGHPLRIFYRGKVETAKYFCRNILPNVFTRHTILQQEDTSALEIPEAAF